MIRNRSGAYGQITRRGLLKGASTIAGAAVGSGLLKGFPAIQAQDTRPNSAVGNDFVLTPRGLRHRSLIHSVRGGSRIVDAGTERQIIAPNGALTAVPVANDDPAAPPPPPTANGWQSWAYWYNDSNSAIVEVFEASWTVPPPPTTNSGQTIYLFNSLLTASGDHILQPVLQWGPSAAPGSGQNWAVASWWVGNGTKPAFMTELVPVNVGDKLVGRISAIAETSKKPTFRYTCEFVGIKETAITADNLPPLPLCTETLEVYGVGGKTDYPGGTETVFTDIQVQPSKLPAPIAWSATGNFAPSLVPVPGGGIEVHIVYPTS